MLFAAIGGVGTARTTMPAAHDNERLRWRGGSVRQVHGAGCGIRGIDRQLTAAAEAPPVPAPQLLRRLHVRIQQWVTGVCDLPGGDQLGEPMHTADASPVIGG